MQDYNFEGRILDVEIDEETGRRLRAIAAAGENPNAIVKAAGASLQDFRRFLRENRLANQPEAETLMKVWEHYERPKTQSQPGPKQTFINELAGKVGISPAEAREVVDAIFSTDPRRGIIAKELSAGRDFTITGFGTFRTSQRKAHMGRNPQTGEQIRIPAMTVPRFRAGKGLRERVRE